MKCTPNLWRVRELSAFVEKGPKAQTGAGFWVPARPLGVFSLRKRIRLAWRVFVGRYDALEWSK
jgi:hypothetical protein